MELDKIIYCRTRGVAVPFVDGESHCCIDALVGCSAHLEAFVDVLNPVDIIDQIGQSVGTVIRVYFLYIFRREICKTPVSV